MIGTTYQLADLVQELRSILASDAPEAERMAAGGQALARLLANPECLTPFGPLPPAQHNWLLHAEPDGGFTVAALVKAPGARTGVHDHGPSWTLYGVLAGAETITRYERLDDGRTEGRAILRPSQTIAGAPGVVDVVPPDQPHDEASSAVGSTAVIVRSMPMGTFPQRLFDLDAGTVQVRHGGVRVVPAPRML